MAKALEGKIAVITGGNSGMGLATAKRFVAEGARVVITGRRQDQIDLALKEIGSSNAVGVQGDVGKMKDLDREGDGMSIESVVRRTRHQFTSKGPAMNPVRNLVATALVSLASGAAVAAGSPGVERNTQAFLEALAASGGKPIESLSPADARAVLVGAQAGAKLTPADVSEKSIIVDGKSIKLTIVRPAGAKGVLPAFMFFHGGGWILGDFPTHERFVRDLVADSGAAAVFVNYTPSPESHYPVAINEAYAATKWVAENGAQINVDGKRLAVAGNSVGGNMAAVVALMAKAKGAPALRAQVLFWPVTNANFENASYDEFANDHFLTKNMMKWFWDAYTRSHGFRLAKGSRRHGRFAAEHAVEGCRGFVANLARDLGNRQIPQVQQPHCTVHAPLSEIVERRFANHGLEVSRKTGPRHACRARQRLHCPIFGRGAVHCFERTGEVAITHGAQPSTSRAAGLRRIGANRMYEE